MSRRSRCIRYSRIKGTNRTGAMILVVAIPSSCFANTISSLIDSADWEILSLAFVRHVRPVRHARAEIWPAQNPRKKVRHEQTARAVVSPAQDARAQNGPIQFPANLRSAELD
jgi:hypothetical protein